MATSQLVVFVVFDTEIRSSSVSLLLPIFLLWWCLLSSLLVLGLLRAATTIGDSPSPRRRLGRRLTPPDIRLDGNTSQPEDGLQPLQQEEQENRGNSFYPRPVAPTTAQVHCLQFLIYEVVSAGNMRKPVYGVRNNTRCIFHPSWICPKLCYNMRSCCFGLQALAVTAFRNTIVTWCLQEKGPVFVAMYKPLSNRHRHIHGIHVSWGLYLSWQCDRSNCNSCWILCSDMEPGPAFPGNPF